jgi:ubiquinone/menaquinone biosynthesis C-methylase UbiE
MIQKPEFDQYAQDYSGGNEDPLKRLLGRDLDHFIRVKARWLHRYLCQDSKVPDKDYRLLDYGCGTGEMLKWLDTFGFPGSLHGADISGNMLETAKKRWQKTKPPDFTLVEGTEIPFTNDSFHCIVATNVFHHIAPSLRDDVLKELRRALKPSGHLVIFEHNPLNPLTRLIVKRAVIDRNAILLYPKEILDRFQKAKLRAGGLRYLMFFPPGLTFLGELDRLLGWCPMGAQYAAVGVKRD